MAQVVHIGYFPIGFCPQSGGPTGSNTLNPVGVDVATAMKWYWKVKTWNMSVFLNTTPTYSGSFNFDNGANTEFMGVVTTPPPENEKGFVCARSTFLETATEDIDQINASFFESIFKSGETYYPNIFLAFYRAAGAVEGVTTFDWDSFFDPMDTLYDASVSIDGVQIPAKTNASGSTINLTIVEEWEFS